MTLPEARAFYSFQSAIETVHNEMYGRLIETFITDSQERSKLFHATQNFPIISEKSQWAMKWIKSDACFAQRLVAFACVEGIFFSGSFCAVFWLRTRGVMPGLCFSNELISRDEGLHTDFACFLYRKLECKLSEHSIHGIVSSAVDLECKFCKEALPTALLGINAASMAEYIRFVADRLLIALGVSRIYRTSNPFPWMEQISLQGKTNFFERRVGEYQRAGVMDTSRKVADRHVFTLTADF